MSLYELILKRRSIRRFEQKKIPLETLKKLVNAARLAPSGSNLQPWEFMIINEDSLLEKVFPTLAWAGYIAPEGNPSLGERPVAYVILLVNKNIRREGYEHDLGAAAQNIMLTALEEGIGSCWLGSIKRDQLRKILNVPEGYLIDTVIALGYPQESPLAEDISPDKSQAKESIRYYKDKDNLLHVPKRRLEDILHINRW
jgi:nitroreductase